VRRLAVLQFWGPTHKILDLNRRLSAFIGGLNSFLPAQSSAFSHQPSACEQGLIAGKEEPRVRVRKSACSVHYRLIASVPHAQRGRLRH
jgi:hypothetical protein